MTKSTGPEALEAMTQIRPRVESTAIGKLGIAPKGASEKVAIKAPVDPFLTSMLLPAEFAR
jgi:hypothetical protein